MLDLGRCIFNTLVEAPDMKTRFYLKKPGEGRASFMIIRDIISPDGKRYQSKVSDERIDSINKLYKSKLKDLTIAEIEIRNVMASLVKMENLKSNVFNFHEDNEALVKKYWDSEYAHRDIVDLESARNELHRATRSLGNISLVSATKLELEKTVNSKFKGNKQRRIVATVNRLLSYAGRTVKLRAAKKERKVIKYLNAQEMKSVLTKAEYPYNLFFASCFVTGGRKGEVFSFKSDNVKSASIFIDSQLDQYFVERDTKNRRHRSAPILLLFEDEFNSWLALSEKDRFIIRNIKLSSIFKNLCKNTFDDKSKHCTVHDLRHSYAVYLLSKGVSLSLVAQCLGISEQVCQEHYSGFVLNPEGLEMVNSILRRDGETR